MLKWLHAQPGASWCSPQKPFHVLHQLCFVASLQDHDADEVAKLALLLPRVTAAVLPDLLRITCSQGCRAMTDMLLRYDMDCLYVLHPRPTGARNANRQRSTAESAQQALQAQELIVELLLEAVKGGDQMRVHRLCSVPAAQKLGEFGHRN